MLRKYQTADDELTADEHFFFLCRFPESASQILGHRKRIAVCCVPNNYGSTEFHDRTSPAAELQKLETATAGREGSSRYCWQASVMRQLDTNVTDNCVVLSSD